MPTKIKDNPLLVFDALPRFEKIKAEHIEPAVDWILADCELSFGELEDELASAIANSKAPMNWDQIVTTSEKIMHRLECVWGPIGHLFGVKNSPELRAAYEAVLPKVISFGLRVSQSQPLFKAMKMLSTNPTRWKALTGAQQRVLRHRILDAEHTGIGLEGDARQRFNEVSQELSRASTIYSNNVLDATKAFNLVLTTREDIAGLPQHLLDLAAESPNGPWRFTLDAYNYIPFMEFAERRDHRETMYRAFTTRASQGTNDNSPILHEILSLRAEKAALLGYKTYADLSLAVKMAGNVPAVDRLIDELVTASREPAKQEHRALQEFALKHGCNYELTDWDIGFWSERQKEEIFQFKEEELRPYFQFNIVLAGLFDLVKGLFGIVVQSADGDAPTWHPDVRFFHILNDRGNKIASFYLDPFSRPAEKRGGAWMNNCRDRRLASHINHDDNKLVTSLSENPVAYLICNGTPPTGSQPALMSFDQVRTLFHEFGHGLQHMLTSVDIPEVAGINGVEWDAVELASQFMENWLFHAPTLLGLTKHVETGAKLPAHYLEKLIKTRTYRAASQVIRQLQFAKLDMELHARFTPGATDPANPTSPPRTAFTIAEEISNKIGILPARKENRTLCTFSHIFAGGYAAGYYSYKWAEVLSADAFSAFEEAGLDNPQARQATGQHFRDTVLSLGGSEHPMTVFKKFRGREPSTQALLRHNGLR